jgi:antitoxin (DNA-binding transcriptional repressor) of toxin-antitoxin stability system
MERITATELARNLRALLDRVSEGREEYLVERGRRPVARILPSPGELTAEQAMADLYRTLPDGAGDSWLEDARKGETVLDDELRDPWAT